jgi:hypothetical protein
MTMKSTVPDGLPYPESGDHTRTWEHWQAIADRLQTLLSSTLLVTTAVGAGRVGGTAAASVLVNRVDGGLQYVASLIIDPGGIASIVLTRAGVEVGRLRLRPDGTLATATARPLPYAAFTATVAAVPVGTGGKAVAFPAGRFTAAPVCVANLPGSASFHAEVGSITTTGCTVVHNGSAALTVQLLAIQMTPTGDG